MYGLQGGAVNLILLLVSDIDDNFWFLTAQRTEKLVIINKTSFVTIHPTTKSPSDPGTTLYKATVRPHVGGDCGGYWRSGVVSDSIETVLAGFTQLRRRTLRHYISLFDYKCILV